MRDEEPQAPLRLSPGQLAALRNLAHKQGGDEVDWINIADARALTERGLAERSREGWRITAEGVSALTAPNADAHMPDITGGSEHEIIQMRRANDEGE